MADCGAAAGDVPTSANNGAMGPERANRTHLEKLLAQHADRLGIPDFLLRLDERPSTIKRSDHQKTLRSLANKPDHRDRSE